MLLHMLSLFPQILFLSPFAALIIRLAIAVVFAYCAWRHIQSHQSNLRAMGVAETALAVALALGIWTQADALIALAIGFVWLAFPSGRLLPKSTILLTLVMSLTLLVTGAGAIAFDFPL